MLVERIKTECSNKGISITEMEEAIGLTPKGIYRWNVSAPAITKVKLVADYLHVSIDYLMERDYEETEPSLPYETSILLSKLNREGISIINAVAKGLSIQDRYQKR